jgi:hypothetical protein
MSSSVAIPYFPNPPVVYSQPYMSQVVQAFALFAQQTRSVGPVQASALKLTNLSVFADNAAAVTGGLVDGDVYKTAAGELRIVV